MASTPYVPIAHSRLRSVELPYNTNSSTHALNNQHDVIPLALGPCSQAIEIFSRHQDQCYGSFPSKWVHQKDTATGCMWENNVTGLSAYYTEPRTNNVTSVANMTPVQQSSVQSSAVQQPQCVPGQFGGSVPRSSSYSGITSPPPSYR